MSLIAINWKPDARQLRTFGAIGATACLVLASVAVQRQAALGIPLGPSAAVRVALVLRWAAAAIAALAVLMPRGLQPLYVALTAITMPIGIVVSYLIMALLFFGVITPVALVFRLIGRDALERRVDRARPSYWIARTPVSDPDRYFHQY